jgi:hypothetical protein
VPFALVPASGAPPIVRSSWRSWPGTPIVCGASTRGPKASGYSGLPLIYTSTLYISNHQSHDFLSLAIARRLSHIAPDPALTRQAPKDDPELALPEVQDLPQLDEVQNALHSGRGSRGHSLEGTGGCFSMGGSRESTGYERMGRKVKVNRCHENPSIKKRETEVSKISDLPKH